MAMGASALVQRLQLAVADHPLLQTSDLDYRLDEHLKMEEDVRDLLESHGVFKCQGLIDQAGCTECMAIYGDRYYGKKLKRRLKLREVEQFIEESQ